MSETIESHAPSSNMPTLPEGWKLERASEEHIHLQNAHGQHALFSSER